MHINRDDIPTKIDIPGAHARQAVGFGDVTGYETLGAEYFSLGAGVDIAPLLVGLDADNCHAPHWGYMISGSVVVTYADGTEEVCSEKDLFFWPAGHSVRVERDAEVILFSPQREHTAVMDHMLAGLAS